MIVIIQIFFWLALFFIVHSYLLYPLLLKFLAKSKKENDIRFTNEDALPTVSIVMAVHNEEKIIEKKIKSVYTSDYPIEKIEFLIGSDNSTDKTNEIIRKYQRKYPSLRFFEFKKRSGKIKIINVLVEKSRNEVLVSTDAKAILEPDTLKKLVEHFKNEEIVMVGANLVNEKFSADGISFQENYYMTREIEMKYREGVIWGHSIGIYGALYAIRRENFIKVPENLLVDDFYENMKIIEAGGKVVFNKNAIAKENLPVSLKEEFRRKVRISTGNFQNLIIFKKKLLNPFNSVSFAYISHKVIRWLAPFIFVAMLVALLFLSYMFIYKVISFLIILFFALPLFDFILKIKGKNLKVLRLVTHFIAMNLAIVVGFFKFLSGVKKSYWKPSNRIN